MTHEELCDVCGEVHDTTEDAWTLNDAEWFRHYGMCGACGRSDCGCGGCTEASCSRCPEIHVAPQLESSPS